MHESFRPNESESLNSQQLSSLFGPGLKVWWAITRVMFSRHVFMLLNATDGIVLMYHEILQTYIERDVRDQLGAVMI